MDSIVEDKDVLFNLVFEHLRNVDAEPTSILLDPDLLKRADRALDASTPQPLLWRLLQTGENLLPGLQQDPQPLTRLLERTILLLPFDGLKTVISADKLIHGMSSPSVSIQLLCLAYLQKAADTPSGAAFVAVSSDLVKTLMNLWLSSAHTGVADRCLEVLIALLTVDSPDSLTFVASLDGSGEAHGQGLIWRRLFHDVDVYTIFLAWTSSRISNHDLQTRKGQDDATLSQARLFDFVVRAANLDWTAITTTFHPSVDEAYSTVSRSDQRVIGGLLGYTAYGMISLDDYLMKVLQHDFFVNLLQVAETENKKGVSQSMIVALQDGAGLQRPDLEASNGLPIR